MSFNYARVFRDPMPTKSYGYDKVSNAELKSIIMRVQKPTHSSDQNTMFPEGYFKHPIRPRSGLCHRVKPEDATHATPVRKRGMSPKLMNRMVRRMQTTTISRMAANGEITPEYEARPPPTPQVRNPEEEKKFLRRITRPTSSTHRRDLDSYWNGVENSEYYDTQFNDEVPLSKEEMDEVVQRVRTPTVSSEHGEGSMCPKRRLSRHIDRDKLPLVSGLARSKKVDDIVERLYRPKSTASSKRTSTTSTDIYTTQH